MHAPEVTRMVRLPREVDRTVAPNERTRIASVRRLAVVSHGLLFNRHHLELAALLEERQEPGVLLAAISATDGLAGHLWLAATPSLRTGSIGRHGSAELFLPWDDGLSLRHLLALVWRNGDETRLRLVDLLTPTGFHAESGALLRSAESNGPLVLRVAGFSLFALPTGGPLPWNPAAEDPFASLPARTLSTVERPAPPPPPRHDPDMGTARAQIWYPPEPPAERLLDLGETASGRLIVQSTRGTQSFLLGESALARGVLLGRYERCGIRLDDPGHTVSRVHAFLIRLGGTLVLADAGSSNGLCARGKDVRSVVVTPRELYGLSDEVSVFWVDEPKDD
jgi:hypothetical protein